MAKSRDPGLADFGIHLYGYLPLKIRATSLIVVDQWVYLRDAGGNVLFAAPHLNVHYVKRLEPGEELAAPERAPDPEAVRVDEIPGIGTVVTDPQCTAQTTAGRRCRLPATPGTDKCSVHA